MSHQKGSSQVIPCYIRTKMQGNKRSEKVRKGAKRSENERKKRKGEKRRERIKEEKRREKERGGKKK